MKGDEEYGQNGQTNTKGVAKQNMDKREDTTTLQNNSNNHNLQNNSNNLNIFGK